MILTVSSADIDIISISLVHPYGLQQINPELADRQAVFLNHYTHN